MKSNVNGNIGVKRKAFLLFKIILMLVLLNELSFKSIKESFILNSKYRDTKIIDNKPYKANIKPDNKAFSFKSSTKLESKIKSNKNNKTILESMFNKKTVYKITIASYSENSERSRKVNLHNYSEIVFNDIEINMKINNIKRKLFYEDILYFDSKIIFQFKDLQSLKSKFIISKLSKLRIGIDKIISNYKDFDDKGIILFRKINEIPGNYQTKIFVQAILIYFPDTEPPETKDNFIKDLMKMYIKNIRNQTNMLKLQKYYQNEELIEVQYYTKVLSDKKKNNNSSNSNKLNHYALLTKLGIVLNESSVISPSQTIHSFRYSQLIDCHAEDPSGVKKLIVDKDLANKYQPDAACIGFTINWNSVPSKEMACSNSKHAFNYEIEKRIFESTLFEKCFENGMDELILQLKNNHNSLQDVKFDPLKKYKFSLILEDILKFDYDKYVNKSSQFYSDFILLKKGAKKYLMELIGESINNNSNSISSNTSSNNSSSSNSLSQDSSLSALDIENYSSKTSSLADSSLIDFNKAIQNKWSGLKKDYGAGYRQSHHIVASDLSTGTVIQNASSSTSDTKKTIENEIQQNLNNNSLTYSEKQSLKKFINNNNEFFSKLKKHNVKLDKRFIENIMNKSAEEVKRMYNETIDNPNYNFLYEKKLQLKNFAEENNSRVKWKTNTSESSMSKNDFHIIGNNYGNSNFGSDNYFKKENVKCKTKATSGGDADSTLTDVFEEPPVEEDNSGSQKNKIVIAIPPGFTSHKTVILPSENDKRYNEQPYDTAGYENNGSLEFK